MRGASPPGGRAGCAVGILRVGLLESLDARCENVPACVLACLRYGAFSALPCLALRVFMPGDFFVPQRRKGVGMTRGYHRARYYLSVQMIGLSVSDCRFGSWILDLSIFLCGLSRGVWFVACTTQHKSRLSQYPTFGGHRTGQSLHGTCLLGLCSLRVTFPARFF